MSFYAAILVFLAGWLFINITTYRTFAADKRYAEQRLWRISEAWLLTLAFVGGSVGAKIAQKRKRHKTRKQPFAAMLNFILIGHILVLAAVTYAGLWMPFFEAFGTELEALFSNDEPKRSLPKRFGPGS